MVSCMYKRDYSLLTVREIILLSRHKISFLRFFCYDSRFDDLVQSVLNYTRTLEFEHHISFLQAQTEDIAWNMTQSCTIQDKTLTTCIWCTWISMLFLKSPGVHDFIKQQNKQKERSHEWGIKHWKFSPSLLPASTTPRYWLRLQRAASTNHRFSLFQAQSFYNFGKHLSSWYHVLDVLKTWRRPLTEVSLSLPMFSPTNR